MIRRVRGLLRGPLLLALLFMAGAATAQESADMREIEVRSSPIASFRIGFPDDRSGPLEFVGGFSMSGSDAIFGQLSGFRFLSPGRDFVGVADHGYWVFGTIERDEAERPVGVGGFRMQPMVDGNGEVIHDKAAKDAEGISIRDGIATVVFEREARVSEFLIVTEGMGAALRDVDFIIPRRELRYNQGMETVAHAPAEGPLEGARVVVAERSIDANGNIFAAVLEGPRRGIFKVARYDDFDVTDGAFLPGGDLLLLERRFSMTRGVGMRLRRIAGDAVRPDALVDGDILLEADLAYQIDNMEALDVWERQDGSTMVSLMSDDNQSFFQRSLYLEFRLAE